MELTIKLEKKPNTGDCLILITDNKTKLAAFGLSEKELAYVAESFRKGKKNIALNQYSRWVMVVLAEKIKDKARHLENFRKLGEKMGDYLNKLKLSSVHICDTGFFHEETLCYAEGMVLGSYQFLKYKQEGTSEKNSLRSISLSGKKISQKNIDTLSIVLDATCKARDLVNEPVVHLTAVQLSKEFQKMGKEAGFSVEVFNKAKIQSLRMGGLLAVNAGSIDPPTFTIMEYKPARAKNKKPVVLVGKGVVFDTGGLSLKPTLHSMDSMKSDMAGAAAVGCTMYAIAKAKLPVHVIALVPATDNRPGGNAITPGDVITMHSGLTVEILNTDAEGRLILGDALSFAKQYEPELVIDLATLTGAAVAAVGMYGIVCMGNASEKVKNKLKESSFNVHERLAEFPFWDEYAELIKSEIAEIKNVGGPYGGAITAGKFLERFVDYPWMHFDIAGPSFLSKEDSYRLKGGTGVGVRLLYDFLSRY